MTAETFDLYRLSRHDGPGMRTVLFLKGCPLRCGWCHNPESFNRGTEIWAFKEQCIKCGSCISVCPVSALNLKEDGIDLDRDSCTNCLKCTEVCPSKALRSIGREQTIEEIINLLLREKPFMARSGGGLTVSGGEPLLQSDFVRNLFRECRSLGIHTAVDTCGHVPWGNIEKILPFTDLVLFDLKHYNNQQHAVLTGTPNTRILDNLDKLYTYIQQEEYAPELWIRTPLIPEATATTENIDGISSLLNENYMDQIARWELCAFNPLATEKYARLKLDWKYKTTSLLTIEEFTELVDLARRSSVYPDRIYSSGLTAKA